MSAPATVLVQGDSHSAYITTQGGRPDQQWHQQMAELLTAAGINLRVRSFALAGATSSGVLSRQHQSFLYDDPSLAFLYVGVNDPGNGIDAQGTQKYIQAIVKGWKYRVMGRAYETYVDGERQWRGQDTDTAWVAGQASLPANGSAGQRYIVLDDTSTTGGVQDDTRDGEHDLVAGTISADSNGQKQTVWEFRNTRAGEYGWARVATNETEPWGIDKIVVVSTPYRNTGTGGADDIDTPLAANVLVRDAQVAAVDEENVTVDGLDTVVYGDIYDAFRQRIIDGKDPDFSGGDPADLAVSWHNQEADQHLNPYGKRITAEVLTDLIRDTWPDWPEA